MPWVDPTEGAGTKADREKAVGVLFHGVLACSLHTVSSTTKMNRGPQPWIQDGTSSQIVVYSQMEARIDRVIRRARRIRKRVGASSDELSEPLWDRPKGMHEKTFSRYAAEYGEILDEFEAYVRTRFGL